MDLTVSEPPDLEGEEGVTQDLVRERRRSRSRDMPRCLLVK